ncbi:hypothetical protein [Aureibaculum luteum]|uniref:hypothetical protein n=1 Tax=Aureibaculum luteum TaxID=1548456 RepID=UPI000E47E7B2|nr:hypothetical protein [Aureibaculum luteum]
MKNVLILLLFIVFSCSNDFNASSEKTETTVKGNVSDIERNFPIKNFKIVLLRVWDDWSVVQYAPGSEVIDSVRTDSFGNYSITFNFIKGERYAFEKQYYGNPYYTESIGNTDIIEGNINIRNINAWYPTVLKLNLNIHNNNYPAMRISSHILENNNSYFPTVDIFDSEIDTIAYIRSKPNSNVQLNFHYSTGYSNEDYHYLLKEFTTGLQDTISLSYKIDCSTF